VIADMIRREDAAGGYGDSFPNRSRRMHRADRRRAPTCAECGRSSGARGGVHCPSTGSRQVQRIEQCGDRVAITGGSSTTCAATARANGVNDVAEFDKTTPITVVATFEDGVPSFDRRRAMSETLARRNDSCGSTSGSRALNRLEGTMTDIDLDLNAGPGSPIPSRTRSTADAHDALAVLPGRRLDGPRHVNHQEP